MLTFDDDLVEADSETAPHTPTVSLAVTIAIALALVAAALFSGVDFLTRLLGRG